MRISKSLLIFAKRNLHYLIILASVIFALATFVLLKKSSPNLNSFWLFFLLYADILLISFICFFIFTKIQIILKEKKTSHKNHNRFHKQVIILFSGVTVIPAACVFVFALLFFNVGVENLFKTPVKNGIENANKVASIYINDMKFTMENFIGGLSERVLEEVNYHPFDKNKIKKILDEETSRLNVDAILVQSVDKNTLNILAKSAFTLSLQFEKLPQEINFLEDGRALSWESEDLIVAAQIINSENGLILLTSTKIDPIILEYKHNIQTAISEYTSLATQRSGLKITFIMFFSTVTALLLLISILCGILFANWILKPVDKLIVAVKNIESGNYTSTIKCGTFKNEWDILIFTFNNMISKLEQQKQQIIISNKQTAWRDIARKIAHEIKNPLTPIQLSAERLKNKYQNEIQTSPEIFNSCLNTIIRQVHCIGTLVSEFSNFARMPAPKIEKTDIITLLNDVIMMHASANKEIAFHQKFTCQDLFSLIDPLQFHQVFINILQNAINAIKENNILNNNQYLGNISVALTLKNNIILITIEDDGPGFSDDALNKALDPYFTTRGKGNGLGLAIVYKIITDHGGDIKLGKSNLLNGAKVSIEIPYVRGD